VQVFVRVYSVVTSAAARVGGRRSRGERRVRVLRGRRRCIVGRVVGCGVSTIEGIMAVDSGGGR